jgi:superfamily II DNA or RNA helicase
MLLGWGGDAVYAQAEGIVRKGLVLKAELKGDLLAGIVARESATEIHTKLRLRADGSIESLCPCLTNRNQGLVCPHVVALGIALMLRHSDPLCEQKYREDQRRARRLAEVDSSAYIQRGPRGTPARLRLTLPRSWTDDFWQGRVPVSLHLLLGGHAAAPDALRTPVALSPEDDTLLAVLEDICEGPPPERFELTPPDLLNVLSIASRILVHIDGVGPLAVEPVPISVSLRVDLDHGTGELLIRPAADLPSAAARTLDSRLPMPPTAHCQLPTANCQPPTAHSPPHSSPIFLAHGRQGCVLAGDRLRPMKNVLPVPYHSIYHNDEIVTRDRVLNFLRQELPQLQAFAPVELELTPDLFAVRPDTPVFHLGVKGTAASLDAALTAAYGPHRFPAGSKEEFAIPDPDDILAYRTRNPAAERAALALLRRLGFSEDGKLVGTREVLNFLGSGYPSLVRAGWKVAFSNRALSLLDDLPVVTPVVQIAEKSGGWFDVGFTFDQPGRGPLPPAEIQPAINRGDSFVQLGGQTFLFDRDSIESMRSVFTDCRSRESKTPGHFLLPSVYAPFVQASLNALDGIDVEEPPDWREKAAARNRSGNRRFAPVPLGALESTLRPYQKEGVYWLAFLENSGLNGLLADEMGLGKTLQTLTWLSLPRSDPQSAGKPALVVCPTSLVENWNREAETFAPHLRRLVVSGPDREALFAKIPQSDLVITSYALLRRDLDAYRPLQFSAAVLDEAQHIKNRSTQNAVSAKQLNAVNRLVLTGTPVENSVADLWSIMDFLMPDYLGGYEDFRLNYELPVAAGDSEGEAAQAKLRRKIHPFLLRRLKKDVAKDLPDKITKVAFCPLTLDQQRVYNDLLAEMRRTVGNLVKQKGFEKSRFEILALLMRLRQACCHLDLLKDHHRPGAYEAPSAKIDAFLELLDEAMDGGHRILVFSQFVGMLKLLRGELDRRGLTYCYLDGSTQDRLQQCQRFNLTPDIPLFLISLKAGGTGLNLTGADMVVHFDPWWNPAVEDQATDRAHRIGQKRTVYSIKLIAEHTVEEKVLDMQRKKQAVIDATVGATDEAVMQKLSFDDLRDLIGL